MEALEEQGRFDEAEALAHASVHEQLCDVLRAITKTDNSGGSSRVRGSAAGAVPEASAGNALIIDGKALQHALQADIKDALLAVSTVHGLIMVEYSLHAYC